jgi:hypothetical protein
MDQWIARQNITALSRQLGDGRFHDNEAELRRQLAEQQDILGSLTGLPKPR